MGINQIQSLKGQSLLAPAIILSTAVIIENLALKRQSAKTQNGVDFGGHRRAFCYEDNEFKAMRGNKKCR